MKERTSVLTVGGSLCGLAAAVFLAEQGVRNIVIERHPGTAIHPRARGLTARTMELFRSAGMAERVHEVGQEDLGVFVNACTLADEELRTVVTPPLKTSEEIGPIGMYACDQDRLEPVLLEHARKLGADVRFSTEMVDYQQDADGVTVHVRDCASGAASVVRADYLIAADGTHSSIRRSLGIERQGPGTLENVISILFHSDLSAALRGRTVFAAFLTSVHGVLVRRDSQVWQLGVQYYPEKGESLEDFTEQHCVEVIRRATGLPDVAVQLAAAPAAWEIAALVADRFQDGRIFLVGDSAHVASPRGGLGGNTGIQDGHNLAWKLSAVLNGLAGPGLLDTYEAERRPVAKLNVGYSVARLRGELFAQDYVTVTLGYRYYSSAVLPDGTESTHPGADSVPGGVMANGATPANAPASAGAAPAAPTAGAALAGTEEASKLLEDPRTPTGQPGTRAPHATLLREGTEISTLDLFGRGFVVFAGAGGERWRDAVAAVAEASGIPATTYLIGVGGDLEDTRGHWAARYGVVDGAVIVRPDGFIGWRSAHAADPEQQLRAAFSDLCHRDLTVPAAPGTAGSR
jgi:2-polyprenyl-6-methoxyphenol hydroxylase-like FAD-dependent oxidoreductase